jgi:glycosyltransferase involved in cell wall biosynthesis
MTLRDGTMSSPPKVSVGMPVYNGERHLEEALRSILSQTLEDLEVVISDNASTDRTEEICRDYGRMDERVRYFRMRQNIGIVENFNTVFRLSHGPYFKWAASDDVCAAEYLMDAVSVLDRDPTVVLAWATPVGIDENGKRVSMPAEVSDLNSPGSVFSSDPTVRFRRLLRNIWWTDGPVHGVFRSDALEATRTLVPHHMSSDHLLLVELSLKGRFCEIPGELFFSRVHSGKTSRQARTLRDRAALVDQRTPGKGVVGWWRMIRGYPQRIGMYIGFVYGSTLSPAQKLVCLTEVLRTLASWSLLRARQLLSGRSPWEHQPT